MNVVYIDEKWFHRTRKTQNMYLSHREKASERSCKHKKIMFLSAMARPRYNAESNCVFDGKIKVWTYVDYVQAQKKRIVLFHVTNFGNVRLCSLMFTMCVSIFTGKEA
jgi:hypothetical protein